MLSQVFSHLHEIDLTHNDIGDEGSEWLRDAFIGNTTTLFKIVLCNNHICEQGAG